VQPDQHMTQPIPLSAGVDELGIEAGHEVVDLRRAQWMCPQ
jgi:hypothetical protein